MAHRFAHAPAGVVFPDRAVDGLIIGTAVVTENGQEITLARFDADGLAFPAFVPLASLIEEV